VPVVIDAVPASASSSRRALPATRPFGIDLCSGVRTNGRLDESKLAAFFTALEPSVNEIFV
jgi:phosphoribosylanthranilate isomerase